MDKDCSLKTVEKILDICLRLKADHYINAISGTELYSKDHFMKKGIVLNFIKTMPITYTQFKNIFVPNLSIVDVLMFNSKEMIGTFLNQYALV